MVELGLPDVLSPVQPIAVISAFRHPLPPHHPLLLPKTDPGVGHRPRIPGPERPGREVSPTRGDLHRATGARRNDLPGTGEDRARDPARLLRGVLLRPRVPHAPA